MSGAIFKPGVNLRDLKPLFTRVLDRSDFEDGFTPHGRVTDAAVPNQLGNPSEYWVDEVTETTIVLELREPLECAITWCVGHDLDEADTWDELTHDMPEQELSDDLGSPWNLDQYGLSLIHAWNQESGEHFYADFAVVGQMSRSELLQLADELDLAAGKIRALLAATPTLEPTLGEVA